MNFIANYIMNYIVNSIMNYTVNYTLNYIMNQTMDCPMNYTNQRKKIKQVVVNLAQYKKIYFSKNSTKGCLGLASMSYGPLSESTEYTWKLLPVASPQMLIFCQLHCAGQDSNGICEVTWQLTQLSLNKNLIQSQFYLRLVTARVSLRYIWYDLICFLVLFYI